MAQATILDVNLTPRPAILATGNTITATVDPTASNDNTQGYSIGSWWLNTTYNRLWECLSAATGAAVWNFAGAAYGSGGANPSSEVTQAGQSTAFMAAEGNIYRLPLGTPVSPGATGADNVLATYTLPASLFDISGRTINILAQGSFASNGNNKTLKLWFGCTAAVVGSTVSGGTTIATTGVVTTNGGGWAIAANVAKYGAAGSNTQIALHQQAQAGATVTALQAQTYLTATESGPIIVAVTGNAATATSDILLAFVEINAMN